ncbi:MAG: hypothetical protein WD738_21330 [Pirellulales bacterium]
MKTRHKRQANQVYQALLAKQQTWSRPASTIDEWAEQFEELEADVGDRNRIEKVLEWYCDHGIGALFVPMVGNAESFRSKFDSVEAAMNRLAGQRLRYFDKVLDYDIKERRDGTVAQKECSRVMQRVQQQIDFVDDLANGRKRLPNLKANLRNGRKPPTATALTAEEKEFASRYVLASRELLYDLLLQNPANEAKLEQRIMSDKPFMRRLERYLTPAGDRDDSQQAAEHRRRHLLKPEPGKNPHKAQAEYKKGKRAYWLGKKVTTNPYHDGSLSAELWAEGWTAAKECERTNPKVAAEIIKTYRRK